MSPDKSAGRLLIIDEEVDLAKALSVQFNAAGYETNVASRASEGIVLALTERPNLILLAVRLPDMTGLDAFQALHDKPRTGHIPVMILAGHQDSLTQAQFLEAGAYDFIEKPVDVDILMLRVRNALRRAEREGLTEPRTGLPTGRMITERLRILEHETGWYKIDLKIDGFSDFRDLYGFVTANEALRFAGNLVAQIVNEQGSPDDFVGHVTNTEEFVIITSQANGSRLRNKLIQQIKDELASFYNFMEREQGYVLVEDGSGKMVQRPLMAAQVQVTLGTPDQNGGDDIWIDAEEPDDQPPDDTSSGSAFSW